MNSLPVVKRILVVDDDECVGIVLRDILAPTGYEVELAPSGPEALVHLEAAPFDLVFTDNEMPALTGVELAVIIKHRWPELLVVLFTGYPVDEGVPGLDAVLNKPADLGKIVSTLQRLLVATPTPPRK